MRVKEGIKGVEERLLSSFFAGNELDVIYQKDIHIPVHLPELDHTVEPQRVYQVVHESFRGQVTELGRWVVFQYVVPNGVHEVSFAETDSSINEKRVIGSCRVLCDRHGSCMGKLVRGTNDK